MLLGTLVIGWVTNGILYFQYSVNECDDVMQSKVDFSNIHFSCLFYCFITSLKDTYVFMAPYP